MTVSTLVRLDPQTIITSVGLFFFFYLRTIIVHHVHSAVSLHSRRRRSVRWTTIPCGVFLVPPRQLKRRGWWWCFSRDQSAGYSTWTLDTRSKLLDIRKAPAQFRSTWGRTGRRRERFHNHDGKVSAWMLSAVSAHSFPCARHAAALSWVLWI